MPEPTDLTTASLLERLRLAEADAHALRATLAAAKAPTVSQADVQAALTWSVDRLQEGLAACANRNSAFAVREFELQAPVEVRIDGLGQLGYRFLAAGEPADPATIGRLRVCLVPVPRDQDDPWRRAAWLADGPISDVPTLDDQSRKILSGQGLHSVGDLLRIGANARYRAKLAELLGDGGARLAGWLDYAELLVIPGVDGPTAARLVEAGVGGLADLSRSDADGLAGKLRRAGATVHGDVVARWVADAGDALGHYKLGAAPAAPVEPVVEPPPPHTDLRDIQGIDVVYAERLAAAGLPDLPALARVSVDETKVRGVSAERLARWRAMAAWLVAHPELDGDDAEVLVTGLGRMDPADPGEAPDSATLAAATSRVVLPEGYAPDRVTAALGG